MFVSKQFTLAKKVNCFFHQTRNTAFSCTRYPKQKIFKPKPVPQINFQKSETCTRETTHGAFTVLYPPQNTPILKISQISMKIIKSSILLKSSGFPNPSPLQTIMYVTH